MPIFLRVDRRIWWLTVSKAADRFSKMSTEDLEAALASLRASVTESRAVSVEWPLLKPDVVVQKVVLCKKQRELVEHNSLKCLSNEWKQVCGFLKVLFSNCNFQTPCKWILHYRCLLIMCVLQVI